MLLILICTKINTDALLELNRLNHLEEIQLHYVKFSNIEDWAKFIHKLPDTVKKLDLSSTNIDAFAFRKLHSLKHLEEILLMGVELPNEEDWDSVIQALPDTLKKICLHCSNCEDTDILRERRIDIGR